MDVLADVGFILYDLYALITGGRKELGGNLAALGGDVLGAFTPFVTGLGQVAKKAGRNLPFKDTARLTEVNKTLDRIGAGGPFPYKQDGTAFKNKEGKLPHGDYCEYTVDWGV